MFRKDNFGVNLNGHTPILHDSNYHNGRINIVNSDDPDARFKMFEKVSVKNKSTEYREALNGLQEESVLSKVYFSEGNIQILQNGLRSGVYHMSNQEIVVPPQNVDNLKIIMRSIYLQYAKHSEQESVTSQVEKLNKMVLDYAILSVYNEAKAYMNYCRDQSTLVMPMEMPKSVDRDHKHLEFKSFV